MCGRYQFSAFNGTESAWIVGALEKKYGPGVWTPGEVRPGDRAPILVRGGDGRPEVELFTWGYPSEKGRIINARAETAEERPMFREGVSAGRCVIPSTGFYEWDAGKRKYLFRVPGKDTLYMAGVYGTFAGQRNFCILTTEANVSVRDVHHRMPLVLAGNAVREWLDGGPAVRTVLHGIPPPLKKESQDAQLSLW